MAFKHRTFVSVPPPANADLDTLNSWHTLERIRVDAFYDEERQRIAAYYGRRANIINTVVLILNAIVFLFNLLIFLGCCAYELPYNGGIALVLGLVFTAYASYRHGEQRCPVMS